MITVHSTDPTPPPTAIPTAGSTVIDQPSRTSIVVMYVRHHVTGTENRSPIVCVRCQMCVRVVVGRTLVPAHTIIFYTTLATAAVTPSEKKKP